MQIGQCAYEINVTTLKTKENEPVENALDPWLEDNADKFIISIDIDRQLNPGFGFITFATIVHRESSLKERGIE